MIGWETSERVLESGGFESFQRVLVAEPVVEASEAGARTLGVTYWQAVDRVTHGGIRASWTGDGGDSALLDEYLRGVSATVVVLRDDSRREREVDRHARSA